MADISKISLPNGTTYNIKDSNALTDNLFNMTPIGVTYGVGEHEDTVLNSDGLPLVAHNRPILINFGDSPDTDTQGIRLFYYMHDAYPGASYEGYKIYSTIMVYPRIDHSTGELIEEYPGLEIYTINPQNGVMLFVKWVPFL